MCARKKLNCSKIQDFANSLLICLKTVGVILNAVKNYLIAVKNVRLT